MNGKTVDPDGNRGKVFALGPVIKYDYNHMSFIGSWSSETTAENRFKGNKFLFKFITSF